ncbi:MAG: shikimate kinase, partial [Akkermansiaceae bacterium]
MPMSQTAVTPQNIVLIGFMGSGKSTVGRELHQRLGYPLIDMDRCIEEAMGKKI